MRNHRGKQDQGTSFSQRGNHLDQQRFAAAGVADVHQQQHGVRQLVGVFPEQTDDADAQGKVGRAGHFQGHFEQQD